MTRRTQGLLFVLSCLLLAVFSDSLATTNCQQSFTFLGKTPGSGKTGGGNPVFWIAEDISGECHLTRLIQIVISGHETFVISSAAKKYEDWPWLKEGIEHLRTEIPVELEVHDGTWRCPGASWTIRTTDASKIKWTKEFKQYVSHPNGWNDEYGLQEILQPEFKGIESELVYFYREGLYVNYQISKAYYFPGSEYILVFTHQPVIASGNDTMHGFLLFKEMIPFSELSDSEQASRALRTFFSLLHAGRYSEAARYCGADCYNTLRNWNPAVAANDYPTLLMYGCKSNVLVCLKVKRILREKEVSPTMFKLAVEFMTDEGGVFSIRGEPESRASKSVTISEFTYTVRKVGDRFLVEGLPPYLQ